jgi:hypothetical protein
VRLDLRPKLVWRLALPLLAVGAVSAAVVDPGVVAWLAAAVLVGWTVVIWRQRVLVVDGVLYQRDLGWETPLLLDELAELRLQREFYGRHYPLVLTLEDRTGTSRTLQVFWGSGWRELVRVAAATGVLVDPETNRRLERI